MSTASVQTKVRNVSATTKTFGYLGRRGKTLAAGEEYTFDGDLRAWLSALPRPTKLKKFIADLEAGHIALVSDPAVHLYDPTLDVTKVVKLDNGTLGVQDPSWGAYSSSI